MSRCRRRCCCARVQRAQTTRARGAAARRKLARKLPTSESGRGGGAPLLQLGGACHNRPATRARPAAALRSCLFVCLFASSTLACLAKGPQQPQAARTQVPRRPALIEWRRRRRTQIEYFPPPLGAPPLTSIKVASRPFGAGAKSERKAPAQSDRKEEERARATAAPASLRNNFPWHFASSAAGSQVGSSQLAGRLRGAALIGFAQRARTCRQVNCDPLRGASSSFTRAKIGPCRSLASLCMRREAADVAAVSICIHYGANNSAEKITQVFWRRRQLPLV